MITNQTGRDALEAQNRFSASIGSERTRNLRGPASQQSQIARGQSRKVAEQPIESDLGWSNSQRPRYHRYSHGTIKRPAKTAEKIRASVNESVSPAGTSQSIQGNRVEVRVLTGP